MIENYISVFQKYTDFDGRASRREFWLFQLANIIIMLGIAVLFFIIPQAWPVVLALYILYFVAIIIPSISVTVRRLHDISKSGWWILVSFVPYVGSIILLIFEVLPSTPGDNIYGPNPYGISSSNSKGPENIPEEEIIEVEEIQN